MRLFQVVVLMILGFSLILGVLFFAGILPSPWGSARGGLSGGTVVMWGTAPREVMEGFINQINLNYRDDFEIQYVPKNPATFENEYIQALARGQGPDLIFIDHEMIFRIGDTLAPVPYEFFSERAFRDTFAEGTEIFLSPTGALALPMTIDPLVMYHNRNIFNSEGIPSVPRNWSEFLLISQRLTRVDERRNVIRSSAPLGQFANVRNAKEILSTLILQSGNPIVSQLPDGSYQSVMRSTAGQTLAPAAAAVDFFVQFADQSRATYSWSRAMPEAQDAFVAESLAIYFGFVGELRAMRDKNPNLNFDISVIPQRDANAPRVTYGRFNGISVVRASNNQTTAFQVAFVLASREQSFVFANLFNGLAPARRDLLFAAPTDAFGQTLYQSALMSKAWVDPDPVRTRNIMANMTENVLLRRQESRLAVMDADEQMNVLLDNR